ncbi:VOC family protein [Niabella terrae]
MSTPTIKHAVWFEIYVDDLDRATAFYEKVLDTQLESMSDPTDTSQMKSFSGDMEKYGTNGALVKMEGMKAGGSNVIIYFHCEDCAIEEARVQSAGGKVHTAKMSLGPHGFCSLVEDTEGNMFGLHSMK